MAASFVSVLHLSDIHIESEGDLVLARDEAIARTTNLATNKVELWVVLVTGDVAMKGKAQHYALAERFIQSIAAQIRQFHPKTRVEVVQVPGNHDCDFDLDTGTRRLLLPQLLVDPTQVDDSVASTCLEVQRPFFEFISRVSPGQPPGPTGALCYSIEFALSEATIRFTCYNTAWVSKLKEKQGELVFPTQFAQAMSPVAGHKDCTVSISAFHHPLAWLSADNRRQFQSYVERTSDIVFTGHEHRTGQFRKLNVTGEALDYCEGGALQLDGSSSSSEFNVLEINITERLHRLVQYEWAEGSYARKSSYRDWLPFVYGNARLDGLDFSREFEQFLNDPGAQFTHPARDRLILDDVFVYPDLNEMRVPPTNRQINEVHSAGTIFERIGPEEMSRVVIYGADDSGKTTLAKRLCRDLTKRRLAVIWLTPLSFPTISATAVEAAIRDQERVQYGAERCSQIANMEPARRVLILDDFQRQTQQSKELLELLEASFGAIVVFGAEMLKLQELRHATSETNIFFDFARFEILPLGYHRRERLVERWFELSRQGGANEDIIAKKQRSAAAAIELATQNEVVPSFPLFLLVILQTVEAATPTDSPATHSRSYGYLHEALILRALSDNPPTDIDTSYKYLSELALQMFTKNVTRVSESELRAYHECYCASYKMPLSYDMLVGFLERVGVIHRSEGAQFAFKYKYLSHYFVARAIGGDAERFNSFVPELVEHLHREQSASILMFLVHLVRGDSIVEQMLKKARQMYAAIAPCDLLKDVAQVAAIQAAPRLVLPGTTAEVNRNDVLAARDTDAADLRRQPIDSIDAATDELNDIVRINAALKTIEILGQIVKSFPGSTLAARKLEIIKECCALGLRAMNSVLQLISKNQPEISRDLSKHLRLKGISESELGGKASQIIYWLSEAWALIFILKTSEAVGLHHLWQTYDELVAKDDSLGVALIDLSLRLEHSSNFPENKVQALIARTAKVPFTRGILARIVYRHFYLYKTDHRIRDRFVSKLKIGRKSSKHQRLPRRRDR